MLSRLNPTFTMVDSPWLGLLLFAGALYVLKLWRDDLRHNASGTPKPGSFPGATPAPLWWVLVGVAGALVLVGIETAGEYALGTVAEQSDIVALSLFLFIGAGILEELVFRGFLVITGRGQRILWLSIVVFSLLFALLHVQYYLHWEEDAPWHAFTWALDGAAAWTLAILFVNSLWFYALRFLPMNPQQSLLPCFAAHVASNLGVFFVKLAQGHVTGWW